MCVVYTFFRFLQKTDLGRIDELATEQLVTIPRKWNVKSRNELDALVIILSAFFHQI